MDLKKFNQLFSEYHGRFIRFAQTYVPAYILVIIKHKCLNYLQHLEVREEASERMKSYAEWELKTRLATLQACDPNELFTAET